MQPNRIVCPHKWNEAHTLRLFNRHETDELLLENSMHACPGHTLKWVHQNGVYGENQSPAVLNLTRQTMCTFGPNKTSLITGIYGFDMLFKYFPHRFLRSLPSTGFMVHACKILQILAFTLFNCQNGRLPAA